MLVWRWRPKHLSLKRSVIDSQVYASSEGRKTAEEVLKIFHHASLLQLLSFDIPIETLLLSLPQLCWQDKSESDPTLQNACLAFLLWGRAQVSFTWFLRPSHVHCANLWRPGSSQASQSLTCKCWAHATSHWWGVLILWRKWKKLPHHAVCLPLQLSVTYGQVSGPGVSSGL